MLCYVKSKLPRFVIGNLNSASDSLNITLHPLRHGHITYSLLLKSEDCSYIPTRVLSTCFVLVHSCTSPFLGWHMPTSFCIVMLPTSRFLKVKTILTDQHEPFQHGLSLLFGCGIGLFIYPSCTQVSQYL